MIFDKGAKAIQRRKIVSSTNGVGTTRHPHVKKTNVDKNLTLVTKINSKWIIDINIRHKAI